MDRTLADIKDELEELFGSFPAFWAVAGGWAIDFFLNRTTRPHKDVEVAIWREDQAAIQAHFAAWTCHYYQDGVAHPWRAGKTLALPVHEVHCRKDGRELEILMNEDADGDWVFRRDDRIRRPRAKFSQRAPLGVPIVSPEIVLIYKSTDPTPTDSEDMRRALAEMEGDEVAWLRQGIERHRPGHPWLQLF